MRFFKENEQWVIRYTLLVAVAIWAVMNVQFITAQLGSLMGVLMPIILGFIFAYILNIPMRSIERHYFPNSDSRWVTASRRPMSVLLALVLIILVIVLVLNLIIPQLISVVGRFVEVLPQVSSQIQAWFTANEQTFPEIQSFLEKNNIDWQSIMTNILAFVNSFTSSLVSSTVGALSNTLSFIFNLFVSLMVSLFVLMSKEKLIAQAKLVSRTYLPSKVHAKIGYILGVTDHSFRNFISGTMVEAVILGSMIFIGMTLFGFPYAAMIGALTGVTALIPVLGAYISASVGFLFIVVENPLQAVLFLIFIVVVQQLEGNLIYPRVVGSSIGLPGLWVLIAITIGGGLWGIPGMLIAVPTASTLYNLLKNDIQKRQSILKN